MTSICGTDFIYYEDTTVFAINSFCQKRLLYPTLGVVTCNGNTTFCDLTGCDDEKCLGCNFDICEILTGLIVTKDTICANSLSPIDLSVYSECYDSVNYAQRDC